MVVGGNRNGKRVQPVEQARPSNLSEEEMQLTLALQLSKQQADEEATLRYTSLLHAVLVVKMVFFLSTLNIIYKYLFINMGCKILVNNTHVLPVYML